MRSGKRGQRGRSGVESPDQYNWGMLQRPLGQDTNCKEDKWVQGKQAENWLQMTNPQLLRPNRVSCCILRVGKCNSDSSDSNPISCMCSACMCATVFVYVAFLNSTDLDRKFSPSPPLSSPRHLPLRSLPVADWLEGERGMRFCRLICQQIATDGPL